MSLVITQGPSAKGMIGKNLATVDGQPERSRTDIEKSSCIGEVDPRDVARLVYSMRCGDDYARQLLSLVSNGCRVR
jgi:hypothetical protein